MMFLLGFIAGVGAGWLYLFTVATLQVLQDRREERWHGKTRRIADLEEKRRWN